MGSLAIRNGLLLALPILAGILAFQRFGFWRAAAIAAGVGLGLSMGVLVNDRLLKRWPS